MSFAVGINEEKGVLVTRMLGTTDAFIYVKITKILAKLFSWGYLPLFFFFLNITADIYSPPSFPCCEQLHLSIISIKNIFGRKSKPSICYSARHFPKPFQLQGAGLPAACFWHTGGSPHAFPRGRGVCRLWDKRERLFMFHQRQNILSQRKQDPRYQYLIKVCKSTNWFEFERLLILNFPPYLKIFIFIIKMRFLH